MVMLDLWQIAMGLFVTTTGMACLYTLLSSIILFTGLKTIQGKELRLVSVTLIYAMLLGFFYAGWNFLIMFKIFEPSSFLKELVSNGLLISILFVIMFLSFSIRQIGSGKISKKEAAKKLSKVGKEKAKSLIGFMKG